jgi:hypothetical protein
MKSNGYLVMYVNGKLFIDTKIVFNGKTYYATKENDGIGKCKYFENRSDIYNYYKLPDPEMKLFKYNVSNGTNIYVMASHETDGRDIAKEWISERYFGGSSEYIIGFGEIIAEVSNTGRGDKLLYKP